MTVCIYQFGWMKSFIVSFDDFQLMDMFAKAHAGITSITAPKSNDVHIHVTSVGSHYLVQYNDQLIETDLPIQIVQSIIFEETVYHPSLFPLHGGAIEADGQAHLFLAPTHAGKTTLIAYLTQKGYPYINDDHILIHMDTLKVVSRTTPIHLRPESVPILKQHGCYINGNVIQIENIHRIVYMPKNVVSTELPVGSIFFIERNQTENFCQNIKKEEAVRLLMEELLSPKANDGNRLKCAIQLAPKCKRLVYSDLQYIDDLLNKEIF